MLIRDSGSFESWKVKRLSGAPIEFVERLMPRFQNASDVVVSHKNLEHLTDSIKTMEEVRAAIAAGCYVCSLPPGSQSDPRRNPTNGLQ